MISTFVVHDGLLIIQRVRPCVNTLVGVLRALKLLKNRSAQVWMAGCT